MLNDEGVRRQRATGNGHQRPATSDQRPATSNQRPATSNQQENDEMGWMLFALSLMGIVVFVLRPKKSPYVRRITRSYNGLGRWRDKYLY